MSAVPEIHSVIRCPTWCRGCGYFPTAHDGRHRGDCTDLAGTESAERERNTMNQQEAEALFREAFAAKPGDDDESWFGPVVDVRQTTGIEGSDVAGKHFFWVSLRLKGQGVYLDPDSAEVLAEELWLAAREANEKMRSEAGE